MVHPAPTKLIKASQWTGALVGSVLAIGWLPMSAVSIESHLMQVGDSQVSAPETAEVNGAAVLAIALAGSAAIGVGLNALLDQKNASQPVRSASGIAARQSGALSLDQVSQPLRRKLFRLLHDDRAAANRLFAQANLKYPGKAPDWYVEKVIFDLERDRGRY